MALIGFELSTCRMYNKLAAFTNTASVVQWIASSTVAREIGVRFLAGSFLQS